MSFKKVAVVSLAATSVLTGVNVSSYAQNANVSDEYSDSNIAETVFAKGLNVPKFPGLDKVEVVNSKPGLYEDPPVGKWLSFYDDIYIRGDANSGWYDANKWYRKEGLISPRGDQDSISCWAATASNQFKWWVEQNRKYIERYYEVYKDENGNLLDGHTILDKYDDKIYFPEFDFLREYFLNASGLPTGADNFFITGRKTGELSAAYRPKHYNEKEGGVIGFHGFFSKVFNEQRLGHPLNLTSFNKYPDKKTFSRTIKNAFENNSIVGFGLIFRYGGVYQHAVTMWGADFDKDGIVRYIYYTDSDENNAPQEKMALLKRRRIVYTDDGKHIAMTKIPDGKFGQKGVVEINTLSTFSLGQDVWQKWYNEHLPESESKKTSTDSTETGLSGNQISSGEATENVETGKDTESSGVATENQPTEQKQQEKLAVESKGDLIKYVGDTLDLDTIKKNLVNLPTDANVEIINDQPLDTAGKKVFTIRITKDGSSEDINQGVIVRSKVKWTDIQDTAKHSVKWTDIQNTAKHSVKWTDIQDTAKHSVKWTDIQDTAKHSVKWTDIQDTAKHSVKWTDIQDTAKHSVKWTDIQDTAKHSVKWTDIQNTAKHDVSEEKNEVASNKSSEKIDRDNEINNITKAPEVANEDVASSKFGNISNIIKNIVKWTHIEKKDNSDDSGVIATVPGIDSAEQILKPKSVVNPIVDNSVTDENPVVPVDNDLPKKSSENTSSTATTEKSEEKNSNVEKTDSKGSAINSSKKNTAPDSLSNKVATGSSVTKPSYSSGGGGGGGSVSNTADEEINKVEKFNKPSLVKRIFGKNRVETSIETSKFSNSDTVVLVSADKFADAISSGNLVNKFGYKLILIDDNTDLNKVITGGIKKAYIIGGEGSVSKKIENEARGLLKNVTRISGKNRYDTNEKILNMANYEKVSVADGRNFVDALGAEGLLVKKDIGLKIVDGSKKYSTNRKVVYTYGGKILFYRMAERELVERADMKQV